MIKLIVDTSLNHRMIVLLCTLLLMIGGSYAFRELPVDALPDLTNVQVQVLTKMPGLAPAEVEKFVTFPIEQAMAGIPKLKQVRSLSQFGLSFVTLVFEEHIDIYWARRQVSQRLAVAKEDIPKGMGTPLMGPLSTGLGEIYQFEVRSSKHTPMELRTLLDWYLAPPLRLVKGVVEVNSFGGQLKTFEVQLNSKKLQQYKINVGEVFHALSNGHSNVGGGYITKAGEQYIVRGEGLITSLQELEAIPIKTGLHGTPIYIRNVAKVHFAPMLRQGAVTRDGRGEAVTGTIMMLQGANAASVIQRVKQKLKQLKTGLPTDVHIDVFYDRSDLIARTLHTVRTNLLEGGLLVVIILFLLLGSIRGGLLVAMTIPLSMLFAFICMRWAGLSGNLMSLGAIDFGIIVDSSVVVIEHIVLAFGVRTLTEASELETVRRVTHEVARPILLSVLIIMVVYLPILTLQGTEGKLFRPMAWVLLFALGGSLLLSVTLIPVLSSYVFRQSVGKKETLLMRLFRSVYEPLLRIALRFRLLTIGSALIVFMISVFLLLGTGANFVPKLDEGMMVVQASRLPSVSLEESILHTTRIERILRQIPEIKSVISKTGRAEVATDPMGVFLSDILVTLKPKHTWRKGISSKELRHEMKKKLEEQNPANHYSFSQPIALRTAELLSGVKADIALKIFGDDLKELSKSAKSIARLLKKIRGAKDVIVESTLGLPYLRIVLNPSRNLSSWHLRPSNIGYDQGYWWYDSGHDL